MVWIRDEDLVAIVVVLKKAQRGLNDAHKAWEVQAAIHDSESKNASLGEAAKNKVKRGIRKQLILDLLAEVRKLRDKWYIED